VKFRGRRSRTHEITCQRAVGLIMDYLDGRLADDDRARFERHLAECDPCTEHLKQIRVTVAAAGRIRDEDLDPLTRQHLVSLYRAWRGDHNTEEGR
jgi:anti-sigma factor RsiW